MRARQLLCQLPAPPPPLAMPVPAPTRRCSAAPIVARRTHRPQRAESLRRSVRSRSAATGSATAEAARPPASYADTHQPDPTGCYYNTDSCELHLLATAAPLLVAPTTTTSEAAPSAGLAIDTAYAPRWAHPHATPTVAQPANPAEADRSSCCRDRPFNFSLNNRRLSQDGVAPTPNVPDQPGEEAPKSR